jgi:uncharacterized protein with LGFP repeats
MRTGGVSGDFGYPSSGIRQTRDDVGTYAVFEGGHIWWSRATDAVAVHDGAILKKYLRVGAASGRLGFPVRGPFKTADGNRANFQHGYITWSKSTGKTAVTYR